MIGQAVAHYHILEKVGSGGMGVVYKARDSRLGRIVALKFLPQESSLDVVAVERFQREARAASSLNHPHICTIHDIGECEGRKFIVMELLEGQTLRELLAPAKRLPVDQILELGIQMADALEAAHSQGIVHRDIKPGNLFLTRRGGVKILDFGLAKLGPSGRHPAPAVSRSQAPTVTEVQEEDLTSPGVALGTVVYMSPEQARAEDLDARTDLFSLGAVLYEMATGRRAFSGSTQAVILVAILNRAPVPPRELNPEIPERLQEIIEKALEKDRELRYQTAAELRADLKRMKRDSSSGRVAAATAPKPLRTIALLVAALVGVAVVAWLGIRGIAGRSAPTAPELRERQLTANPLENPLQTAALSPDGNMLAYRDPSVVSVRVIDTGETHHIALPAGFPGKIVGLSWFPDGTRLLLLVDGEPEAGIWVTSILGNTLRKLRSDAGVERTARASPDGLHIAFLSRKDLAEQANDIWVMDSDGTNARTIASSEKNGRFGQIQWSPDGRRIANIHYTFSDGQTILESRPADGGNPTLIVTDTRETLSFCWLADGRILYSQQEKGGWPAAETIDSVLWETSLDPATGRPTGVPRPLLRWAGLFVADLSVSRDGRRVAVLKNQSVNDVYVAEIENGGGKLRQARRLTLDDRIAFATGWTPDSRAVLISSDRNGSRDIFKQELNRDDAEFVAGGPGLEQMPQPSPDGKWILYLSHPASCQGDLPPVAVMRIPIVGGSPERVADVGRCNSWPFLICPHVPGRTCVLKRWQDGPAVGAPSWRFFALDPDNGKGEELPGLDANRISARFSPDGRRIAYYSGDGTERLEIVDLEGGRRREIPLKEAGPMLDPSGRRAALFDYAWTSDGNGFFVLLDLGNGSRLASMDLQGNATTQLEFSGVSPNGLVPSPDGRHLAFHMLRTSANAWLLETP